jgi:membrane-bound serine protease (ClpP class)
MNRWLLLVVVGLGLGPAPALGADTVALIRVNGAIGPATASYIARGVKQAEAEGARCLVVQLDTPGGLLESTKGIVQTFYASTVPIVVYVAPAGASATSAGCFIALAADVAAMAPNTSIGAAHPVSLGGAGEAQPDSVMKQKVENYAASWIATIAAKRHRSVEWARSSVLESASIRAEEAIDLNVVDLLADDLPDLLQRLDGREINGKPLKTAGAGVVEIPMLAREKVFQLLWRPEVMFVLMLIAIYGIIGELSNPGAILPGVAGAIALILALYMAAILPVNLAGVALVLLAIALFITDLFAPTHGVLTAGGILSFFLGALMLFDRTEPAFRLSLSLILPATIVTAVFFLFVIGAGLRAQLLPVKVGRETMLGRPVTALTPIHAPDGWVLFEGEHWRAVSDAPIAEGQSAEIVGVEGLTLKVKSKT